MRLAFITIHFKNLSDTVSLLDSLNNCQIPKGTSVRTYVVDNSGDQKLRHVISKRNQNVSIVGDGRNLGFSAGNNLGLKQAIEDGCDILVCINNDTYVDRNFFTQILKSPITDPAVGAVGGLIYFAPGYEFKKNYRGIDQGRVVWYAGGVFDWANCLGSNGHVDEIDKGQFTQIKDTDFITGALFITRPDVLKKVGFYDENYFMYLEDVDLSVRIKRAGYKVVFDPEIKMWHKVAQSSGIGSSLNDYFITRNRLYFGLKFTPFRTKFALLREAMQKLFTGTKAQKHAINDFILGRLKKGTWLK